MEMNKLSRIIITAILIAVIMFLAWFFSNIVAYILVSFVLAMLGKPIVNLLVKARIGKVVFPRWAAAIVTLVTIWLIASASFFIFVPIIMQKSAALSTMDLAAILNSVSDPLINLEMSLKSFLPESMANFSLTEIFRDKLSNIFNIQELNTIVTSIADVIVSFGISLFSISFITFFFLKDESLFRDGVVVLFPAKYEDNINRALNSINKLLPRYFLGLFFESIVMLTIITVGLLIVGLSLNDALIIGLIAGILNIIPYVGPFLGGVIGILLGALSHGFEFVFMVQMLIVFVTAQMTDNILLQPLIYSSSVKAHPLEIFLVILVAGSVGGVLGMLLAIPSYTVLRILAKEFFYNLRVVQKLTQKI